MADEHINCIGTGCKAANLHARINEWAAHCEALEARLAEAVAALHDIAHAEPEASALRLRFMAADALIRHNTADSADAVQQEDR